MTPSFVVSVNGKKLCTAGISKRGVVTMIVNAISPEPGTVHKKQVLELHVGGLISGTREHLMWVERRLAVGDEISIHLLEGVRPDAPKRRQQETATERKRWQQSYVRRMAKEFGWRIRETPSVTGKTKSRRG